MTPEERERAKKMATVMLLGKEGGMEIKSAEGEVKESSFEIKQGGSTDGKREIIRKKK